MTRVDVPASSAWHALTGDEVATRLRTAATGLDAGAAAARLREVGSNALDEAPPTRLLVVILRQFRNPLIYILLIATVVTLVLDEYLDATAITLALALNAVLGTVQERKAERSVRALERLVSPRARVVRDGTVRAVDAAELVPGDLVLVESGDRVAADLRLVEATALTVDESLLTGESVPVAKRVEVLSADTPLADRRNLAHAGAVVARGRGRGYVVATGMRTELGRIADTIRTGRTPPTPLQQRLDRFGKAVAMVVLLAATCAFVIGLVRGEPLSEMFTVAVALAVGAIPESLVVVFTIALTVGVTRMARRRAIIRRLPAVETLGSTTVICSDKTGTLTRNEMTVLEVRTVAARFGAGSQLPDGAAALREQDLGATADAELRLTLLAGLLVSEAAVERVGGELRVTGDPTEAALLRAADEAGLAPEVARREHELLAHLPFEPERRYAAAVFAPQAGGADRDDATLVVQGAPEEVLAMCARQLRGGTTEPLDAATLSAALDELAARGLRVLAFAVRTGPAWELAPEMEDPGGLTFVGLQAMADPPRDGVPEAIAACRDAGMRVVMVTGDHAATAEAIAREIGLPVVGPAVTGVDLDRLDDDALRRLLPSTTVFARVSPEQKLRIVEAYRDLGEVVAVTGDGVNDAPALQAAHIGIAMGRKGTDVAREASDMVLADDDFVSIRDAVEEGRVSFDNLRKATFFLVSTAVAEIGIVLAGLAMGWPLVLLPAQILWLNLVTNGVQDLALAFEPGEPDVLRRAPRPRDEGLMSRLLWQRTVLAAVVMAAGTLVMFDATLRGGGGAEEARTVAITTMVLFQAVHLGNARVEKRSAFSSPPWANPFLLLSMAVALGIHAVALHLPPTQWLLRLQPLTLGQWARSAVLALSVLVAVEIEKALRRRGTADRVVRARR